MNCTDIDLCIRRITYIHYSLTVAIYSESVISGSILNKGTTSILNLCILPTLQTDSFQTYALNKREDNDQVSSLGENWIKFREYASLNKDQVSLSLPEKHWMYWFEFTGIHCETIKKDHDWGMQWGFSISWRQIWHRLQCKHPQIMIFDEKEDIFR